MVASTDATTGPIQTHALVEPSTTREGRTDGPLAGVSFVAKDMFALEGHVSSFGHSEWRRTHTPSTTNAEVITRLLDAGANLVGLTKMDQLAYSLIGDVGEGEPPRNVRAPELFCGGSSSGSASAVAAGLSTIGLGTDTAGSIRVPAAACGLHSIRPTHGAIDSSGVLALAPSFDAVGLLSDSMADLDRACRVLVSEPDDMCEVRSVVVASDVFARVDDETASVGESVARRLGADAGCEVREIELDAFASSEVGDLFARLQSREIWATHGPWLIEHRHTLADDVRQRIDRCEILAGDPAAVQAADREQRAAYRAALHELLDPGTVLVVPVVPRHGPQIAWSPDQLVDFRRDCFRLSAPSSLGGGPQVVYSVGARNGRRSIGIGLASRPGGERLLLDASLRLEAGEP